MGEHQKSRVRLNKSRLTVNAALLMVAALCASCGTYPPEKVEPAEQPVRKVQPPPVVESCGDVQTSTREQLVEWFAMTRQDNPELQADLAKWIQMTQENRAPVNTGIPSRHQLDAEPTVIFGMATVTVTPVFGKLEEVPGSEGNDTFTCNGLSIHSKINSQVIVEGGTAEDAKGYINLDTGLDFMVVKGALTLETGVKVDFPGNAIWQPLHEEFVLGDRIHPGGRLRKGESCNLFVLGSEKKDELIPQAEPDHSVVPELVKLITAAPSKFTRALAAMYLGIIRDPTSLQAMLDAFNREQDEPTKADIAMGLGIFGNDAALAPIEEASRTLVNQNELGWKYREAINRLKGIRH